MKTKTTKTTAAVSPVIVDTATNVETMPAANVTPVIAWDAPVVVAPLRTFKNKLIPGIVGVQTADGAHCLGMYAKKEHFVDNKTLVVAFREALAKLSLAWQEDIFTVNGGAVMHALFTIQSVAFNGPDNKPLNLRVRLINSYDGSFKVSFVIEAFRLVCLNGCVGMRAVFELFKRHMGDINIGNIIETVAPQIERGGDSLANSFKQLADVNITNEQGNFMLRNMFLASPLKFSGLMARKIENAWDNPTDDEKDSHNTLFGLYNAATRTWRDMPAEKTPLVQRASTHFGGALIGCVEKPEWLTRLVQPIDRAEAYKRDNGAE